MAGYFARCTLLVANFSALSGRLNTVHSLTSNLSSREDRAREKPLACELVASGPLFFLPVSLSCSIFFLCLQESCLVSLIVLWPPDATGASECNQCDSPTTFLAVVAHQCPGWLRFCKNRDCIHGSRTIILLSCHGRTAAACVESVRT